MEAKTHLVGAGGAYLWLDGCSVYLGRNDLTGQLYVSVNTEDLTKPNEDQDSTGLPHLQVEINGGTVYDYEPGWEAPRYR